MQDGDREQRLRRRAYDVWEREGRPEGRAEEHWRAAESDEAGDDPASSPATPPGGPHAKPELTNAAATPGAGALPDPEDPANSADSTSG